jgi:alpha-L-fucosidase 2
MGEKEDIWGGTWELDGNTGITAAICEMLVQSHDNLIHLLPALPEDWKDGEISGICLRGGIVADISWKNGKLDRKPQKKD